MEISTEQRALEVYEKGVAKESLGSLGDAIRYYSSALKIHKDVGKLYRKKLHDEYQKELNDRIAETPAPLLDSLAALKLSENTNDEVADDDNKGDREEEEIIEPCYLLNILTDDILLEIITILIRIDPHSNFKLASTCHRLGKLCFGTVAFRTISKLVYPHQVYSSSSIQLNNITKDQEEMVKNWDFNWPSMLNDRPFLKYHGTYISKVSYISEGAADYSFYAPVKLVTYFRYLRFHPDGTVLKLTTTDDPNVIIPQFRKENVGSWKSATIARFYLEMDGQVIIESKTELYKFVEELQISSLGYRKFHRLNWITSFTVNKEGERGYFSLKKEKPFNFSSVKSYMVDYE